MCLGFWLLLVFGYNRLIPGKDMGKPTDMQIRAGSKAGERFEGKGDSDGLYLRLP